MNKHTSFLMALAVMVLFGLGGTSVYVQWKQSHPPFIGEWKGSEKTMIFFSDFTYAFLYPSNQQSDPRQWQELPGQRLKVWGSQNPIVVYYQIEGRRLTIKDTREHSSIQDFDSDSGSESHIEYFDFVGVKSSE